MPVTAPGDAETIGVSEFKPRSLELIDRVASGKIARLVLTRRGRPVAALVPIGKPSVELWGALRGLIPTGCSPCRASGWPTSAPPS